MQGQKSNKNVNWNVKETYFNLNINYMTAFDRIKLLHILKKYLLCTLSRSRLVQTCQHFLLSLTKNKLRFNQDKPCKLISN